MSEDNVVPTDAADNDNENIIAWTEEKFGRTPTQIVRQRRWRPVWRVYLDESAHPESLLFKSERDWKAHPYPLEHESNMLMALSKNGIPVPEQFGMCPKPWAVVMDWVKGGRDPGLMMDAIANGSTMSPDRWAASLRYMEILAQMHAIPPAEFAAFGATIPKGPTELALNSFERFHAMFEASGLSDTLCEFVTLWLRRNVPQNRTKISFLTGDCGQFLSEGSEVTAVLDVEIGYLGDPMGDLCCFRGRHPIENMGDLPALFRHYEKASGEPLDLDAMAYHTVLFLCFSIMGPLIALRSMEPGGDWTESAIQVPIIGRRCMEAMAEILGVTLDDVTLPTPQETPIEDTGFEKLIAEIKALPETPEMAEWQRNVLLAIPSHLKANQHFREWRAREDLKDTAALIGTNVESLAESEARLMAFIRASGPEQDAPLIQLFYRRTLRQCLAIAGVNPPADHIALARLEPILHGAM